MSVRDESHEPAGGLRSKRRLRLPRYTIRLRLAILYGGVFLISGTLLLALIFLTVRYSTHGTVVSAQGAVARLVERHSVQVAPPGATLSVVPESLAIRHARAQAHQLGAVAVNVNNSDLHQLLIWSFFAMAIMAIASMGLGWLIAGRVLRPLRTITTAARDISATNLHQRLALDGPDDEFKELGDTFDGLLARLDASFQSQRQFVANASHELRTPLARLKTLVQVALADPNASVESLRATHERVLASEDQLEGLIEALLSLASSERALDRREPVDLATVTGEVIAGRQPEIERRGLRLDATLDAARAEGNTQLLERLVANLVDNAITHNLAGGRIDVMTATEAGQAILSVANDGPVIQPEELERLQRPFQRLGAERITQGGGHGLGLSIVHAIATAHGAAVSTRAQPDGGLDVEVRFPVRSPRTDTRMPASASETF